MGGLGGALIVMMCIILMVNGVGGGVIGGRETRYSFWWVCLEGMG